MNCGRCGAPVADNALAAAYADHDIGEGVWMCRSCIAEISRIAPFADLFERVRDALSPENREKWDGLEDADRATFALKCMRNGTIQGGTVGHMETLRAVIASGLAGDG